MGSLHWGFLCFGVQHWGFLCFWVQHFLHPFVFAVGGLGSGFLLVRFVFVLVGGMLFGVSGLLLLMFLLFVNQPSGFLVHPPSLLRV